MSDHGKCKSDKEKLEENASQMEERGSLDSFVHKHDPDKLSCSSVKIASIYPPYEGEDDFFKYFSNSKSGNYLSSIHRPA